ncbi:MAG: Verru_Chthon cassette protein B [Verrucomicrobium sp.]
MNTKRTRYPSAFSLVETVTALGIVSIAVLTLVALIPSGLDDLRKSSLKQAEARIVQSVVGVYQMVSWGAPGTSMTLPDKELYFDIRGTALKKGAPEHAITAKAVVDKTLPTLSGDSSPSKHLRKVKVLITSQINNPNAFDNPTLYQERSVMVANLEQTKLN